MRRWLPAAAPRALVAPAAAAAALLSASDWLADPGVGYVAACVAATAIAGVAALRWSGTAVRVPLAVTLAALLAAVVAESRAELRLTNFSRAPATVGAAAAADQQRLLGDRVDDELRVLRGAAAHALATQVHSADPARAVVALERAIGQRDRRALLLLRGDTLLVWAGTLHADPRLLTGPSGVVATPFGLTLYAALDSGGRRAVATSLLYAASPADRLTRGLAQRLPSSEITEGYAFGPADDTSRGSALRYHDGDRALFVARALVPSAGEVRLRMLERARVRVGIALLVALVAFLIVVAQREMGAVVVVAGVAVVLRCVTLVPLSEYSTRSRLFDAAVYFFPAGRAFTANAAALLVTAATLLFLVVLAIRRIGDRLARALAVLLAAATIGLGPFVVGALARGITPPAEGAGAALWLIWNVPLCLAATALLVLASWAGRVALGGRRGTPVGLGPLLALAAAVVAPLAWEAPGQWPQWYTAVWSLAVGALVLSRPSRRALLGAAMVAALASATVVWGATSRGRVELAERDVRGLAGPDAYGEALAARMASSLQGDELPRNAEALLERYVSSDLAASAYPVALTSWEGPRPIATFGSAPFDVAFDTVGAAALAAQTTRQRVTTTTRATSYGVRVVAVPVHGGAVTILVAPRTRLIGNDAYARWLGLPPTQETEPLYTVQVVADPLPPRSEIRWRREGNELHGDWPVAGPTGPSRAHVEVDLRGLDTLIPRGGLLVLVDIGAVLVVWLLGAVADGRVGRWLRLRRRRMRSYRTRLSLALALFFLVPAGAFALWSWRQLFDDAQASRRLLVTETIRAVSPTAQPDWLKRESARLDTKLLLYRSGVLVGASDSLFADLAPMGTLLRPDVALNLGASEEVSATRPEAVAGATGMLGYRVLPAAAGAGLVIAAPARVDDLLLDRRRRDLGVLVVFATALGAAAAVWLSGVAARQLAQPIGALRTAARAVARGERDIPLAANNPSEFTPVFSAFRAMAEDLATSRAELARAQRVLAWGEMARQVAHEIKNPLTPIRLGVQHLRRARGRPDFDAILEQNVTRILTEIDRLDEIARAFSRYGGAPEARAAAEPTDVAEVVQDVVELETLGEGRIEWDSEMTSPVPRALARADELREVLLNLFENARLAEATAVRATVGPTTLSDGASGVAIEVVDDGVGIPAEVLPRIFEPHFSTRTSGSGLGLAITRRLVESWGGEVTIASERGKGTTVRVVLRAAGETVSVKREP